MQFELTEAARQLLIEKGFDEKYGARPLKRAIQKYIENDLAEEILMGTIKNHTVITADISEDKTKLVFSSKDMEVEFSEQDQNFLEELLKNTTEAELLQEIEDTL